ncbi:transport protein particle component [Aureobasidium sp. EXF-12298]|nr:transport protein particle component [Aureobasidium sp. EXF-12298]
MATTTSQNTDASPNLQPQVAASTLDFLLIELVPLAQRIATDLHARDTALLSPSLERNATLNTSTAPTPLKPTDPSIASVARSTTAPDSDSSSHSTAISDSATHTLSSLGFRVGVALIESLSIHSARPSTPLDMIKFICKDLWQVVFRKQIDNLKTNHRGTFVLTDNKFLALGRMSVDRGRGARGLEEALGGAQAFLYFPCGIIRGALSAFGLNVTVHAETSELPQAVFQIRTVGSKP